MKQSLYNHQFGRHDADVIFYLPNPPILPLSWQSSQHDAIEQLIALNGNHWRKIVTIMAKLCSLTDNVTQTKNQYWKHIRQDLFGDKNDKRLTCQLNIVAADAQYAQPIDLDVINAKQKGNDTKSWHILCGMQVQQQLGFNQHIIESLPSFAQYIDNKTSAESIKQITYLNKIKHLNKVLLTPYLDYRQFPNALISHTRDVIADKVVLTLTK